MKKRSNKTFSFLFILSNILFFIYGLNLITGQVVFAQSKIQSHIGSELVTREEAENYCSNLAGSGENATYSLPSLSELKSIYNELTANKSKNSGLLEAMNVKELNLWSNESKRGLVLHYIGLGILGVPVPYGAKYNQVLKIYNYSTTELKSDTDYITSAESNVNPVFEKDEVVLGLAVCVKRF